MAEEGIRGGIHMYAKANNKYMKDYIKDEEELFLKYYDANKLYGGQCLNHYDHYLMVLNGKKDVKI